MGLRGRQIATFAELPHISVLLSAYIPTIDSEEVDFKINKDFMQESPAAKNIYYFETQYHGQTGSSDQIEYILYSERSTSREEFERITKILKDINREEGRENKIKLMKFSDYASKKQEEIDE